MLPAMFLMTPSAQPCEAQLSKTSCSGFLTGSILSSTASIKLKIAVLAPIPSASVSTATAAKPGFFSSWRKANLRSFITQCLHRIDSRSASRRNPRSEQRHQQEKQRHGDECQRIGRFDFIEQVNQHPRHAEGTGHTQHKPDSDQFHSLAHYEAKHITARRPKGHSDPDFTNALRNRVSDHPVKTDCGQQQRGPGESAQQY